MMTKQPIPTALVCLFALCGIGCSQRVAKAQTKDPSTFDIDGVHLGMTVPEVEAALRAHGTTPYIERLQSPSAIGGEPFTIAVIAMTNTNRFAPFHTPWYPGDRVLVLFTETEGNKALEINRFYYYDENAPVPLDIFGNKMIERYGSTPQARLPHPNEFFWVFDPAGKVVPEGTNIGKKALPGSSFDPKTGNYLMPVKIWDYCTGRATGFDMMSGVRNQSDSELPNSWNFKLRYVAATTQPTTKTMLYPGNGLDTVNFTEGCGVVLKAQWGPATTFREDLSDHVLAIRSLRNIKKVLDDRVAQRQEQIRKNAEKTKIP